MKKFFSSLLLSLGAFLNKRFMLPFESRVGLALKAFSPREKTIFFIASGVLAVTAVIILANVNRAFLVEVPAQGGMLIEGVLGTPAHINPLLASGEIGSEADRDLTALIYSGLLRPDGKGGMILDLADRYEISDDGLIYTFTLKKNLSWHDGKNITVDDIIFTVKTAQDSRIKSPKRATWDGVGIERVDDLTVRFILKKPYAPFLENATLGILPEHIWKTIEFNRFDINNYNRNPIGSGPYQIDTVETVKKDGDEIPVAYTLKAFDKFALGAPYIKTLKLVFYRNEESLIEALEAGDIEAINSIPPDQGEKLAEKGYDVKHTPLPRVLAVFFNHNQAPIFADNNVRKALSLAVQKDTIIETALSGYGVPLNSPLPPGALGYKERTTPEFSKNERLQMAKDALKIGGWKFSTTTNTWTKKDKKETTTLEFELSTSEAPELKTVAQELQASWRELGVEVAIRPFPTGDLKETIVRPRKFDALFFGQVLGRDGDPYPFWHSNQRLDPGLNVASYVNARVDKLLDEARAETDQEKRTKLYEAFREEIIRDIPAIFLYAPEFLYIVPNTIKGFSLGHIIAPSERFLNIHEWYINTDHVWEMFAS